MPINALAWSVWCLLETQWNVAPMGGLIGWAGYEAAAQIFLRGYKLVGDALMAEIERCKIMEVATMEIDRKRRERREAEEKRKGAAAREERGEPEEVEGDMDDFIEAEEEQQA